VVNSPLDDVYELLRLGYGDPYRLEDIKQRLANGKVLYASDNDYLQKLVYAHTGEIQQVGESKKREPTPQPEPEPEPQPEPQPEPYEQYQPEPQPKKKFSKKKISKKKSSKKKKIGIILIVPILFLLFLAYLNDTGAKINEEKEEALRNMSTEKLLSLSVDWTYTDLLRNIDDYSGEIIFINGRVQNTQMDIDLLMLCLGSNIDGGDNTSSCDRKMFVDVNGIDTWLEEDRLSGFVGVRNLSELGRPSSTTGEFIGSDNFIPRTNEIKLFCENC
jgi:hypothetical protein